MASFNEVVKAPLLSRAHMIESLKNDQFDIIIVGGGATGAGALLDATTRGLKVALIEAADFSAGTSSRSTKLVHGGVRYLENAVKHLDMHEYALVRDALQERERFLRNAPHLSRTLPIITPVYGWFDALYFWIGLKCYDLIAGKASLGPSEFLDKDEALKRFPLLKKEGLKGAVLYYDGQFDDARMNISIVLSAIKEGAIALNYIRVQELIKENDRVIGVLIKDEMTGRQWPVLGKVVINATGPHADVLRKMADENVANIMVQSQGSHLLLPPSFSPPHTGLIIPKTKDGRVIFLLPWQGKTLAGTTDHPQAINDNPKATEEEVDYILEHLRLYFDLPISRHDITATWSGLRPLAKPEHAMKNTASISRDHLIEVSEQKLVTIVGGKWTTYRKMGEEVIDMAIAVALLKPKNSSRTASLKLMGARQFDASLVAKLLVLGLNRDVAEHLAQAYGDQAFAVAAINNDSMRSQIIADFPYIEAEVIYAIRHEYALHASDIIARRLRLAFLSHEASLQALPRIVDLMAQELFWTTEQKLNEIEHARIFLASMFTKERACSL